VDDLSTLGYFDLCSAKRESAVKALSDFIKRRGRAAGKSTIGDRRLSAVYQKCGASCAGRPAGLDVQHRALQHHARCRGGLFRNESAMVDSTAQGNKGFVQQNKIRAVATRPDGRATEYCPMVDDSPAKAGRAGLRRVTHGTVF